MSSESFKYLIAYNFDLRQQAADIFLSFDSNLNLKKVKVFFEFTTIGKTSYSYFSALFLSKSKFITITLADKI